MNGKQEYREGGNYEGEEEEGVGVGVGVGRNDIEKDARKLI